MQTLAEVVLPIVHMNGDTKSTLIGNLVQAYKALRAAQKALADGCPNARNYYPIPGRYDLARAQYLARQDQIEAVMRSLVAEVEGINKTYPDRRV